MSAFVSKTEQNRIQRGPDTTLIRQTIEFVRSSLPRWRDDPHRRQADSENALNLQLSDFLDATARNEFPMVRFSHQEPQTPRRTVDLSAKPAVRALIHGRDYTIYDAILVIEGKRLPAPSRKREREYVSGGKEITGGMQRFKLGLHGAGHCQAVMIGYVQYRNGSHWWQTINQWITELCNQSEDGCAWSHKDVLHTLHDDVSIGMSTCTSQHARAGDVSSPEIALEHMWIVMHATTQT